MINGLEDPTVATGTTIFNGSRRVFKLQRWQKDRQLKFHMTASNLGTHEFEEVVVAVLQLN